MAERQSLIAELSEIELDIAENIGSIKHSVVKVGYDELKAILYLTNTTT